jgi:hypothetical protein
VMFTRTDLGLASDTVTMMIATASA